MIGLQSEVSRPAAVYRWRRGRLFAVLAISLALALLSAPVIRGQCLGCANASFGPAGRSYHFPAGWVSTVVSADFNGDGIPDLAIVTGRQNVQILLGTGSGDFLVSENFPLSGNPFDLFIADMDGDGKVDLVVSTFSGFTVLLLDGAGHVTAQKDTSLGFNPSAFVLSDWNGDGKPDVAVADRGTSVLVFPGDGQGGFGSPQTISVSTSDPAQLLAGDFTGDGFPDLAVLRADGYLAIYPGTGMGSFSTPLYVAVTGGPAVAGDFNRDGILDIAIGNQILIGAGGGYFQSPGTLPGVVVRNQPIGDFNQDGFPDLIVQVGNQGLAVAFGDGAGGFSLGPLISAGSSPYGFPVTVADFDGDGRDDLAMARYDLAVIRGVGSGLFESPPESSTTGTQISSLAFGDFNGDGQIDLVKVDGQNLVVLFNKGDDKFGPAVVTPLPQGAYVAAADFNGDGRMDVAVTRSGTPNVLILLGDGTGHFGPPAEFTATGGSMIVADFNLDGHPDLLVGLDVLLGDGAGGFGPPRHAADGTIPLVVAVADVNGDGRPDLLVMNSTTIKCYFGDGAGGFTAGPATDTQIAIWSLVAGDFDGDGHVDFAVTKDPSYGNNPPYLKIFFGNGTGSFGSPLSADFYDGVLNAADFHGDGRLDMAVSPGNLVSILRVDPARTLTDSGSFVTPAGFAALVADFTGDGKPDWLRWTGPYASNPNVWLLENTICSPRRLGIATNVSSCDTAGSPFSAQPVVRAVDDGDNLISCASDSVTASLMPGTGAPGATLSGTTSVPIASGLATFTDLSVDVASRDYRLLFTHAGATPTGTRPFSVSIPPPAIILPPKSCTSGPDRFEAASGYDSYLWTLDGAVVGRSRVLTLASLSAGSHTLQLTVSDDGGCSASSSVTVTPNATPAPPVASSNGPVPYGGTIQLLATSIADASYQWSGPRGFTSEVQNPAIPNATPAVGGIYRVVATVGGCASSSASTNVTVQPIPWCPGCANASFGAAARALPSFARAAGIVVGDFDGDGNLDIVGLNGQSAIFYAGDGKGDLGPGISSSLPLGSYIQKVVAADINRDGLPDLLIAQQSSSGVLLSLAKGGGQFAPAVTILPGQAITDFLVADFNEDGWPDFAVVSSSSPVVSILLNDGAGGFFPPVTYSVGSFPRALAVGDFNGDHHADLAVVNQTSQSVSVLMGFGNGAFGTATNYGIPQNLLGIAVGDFNGDGVPDLAVQYLDFSTQGIEILAGSANGVFLPVRAITQPMAFLPLQVADVNGDGKDDLIFVSQGLTVLLGKGNFDFQPPISMPAGYSTVGFVLGDLDRDGRTDAVIASNSQTLGYSNLFVIRDIPAAPPTFAAAGVSVRGVVSADFDQDGHPDIAVTTLQQPYGSGGVSVLLNDTAGVLGPPLAVKGGSGSSVLAAADFNGDGYPDLVTGDVAIFLNDGKGGLSPPIKYGLSGSSIAVGDFDGDGKKDLAVGTGTAAWVLFGDGAGGFRDPASAVIGVDSVAQIAVGDFNNDGNDDLTVVSNGGGSVSILLGTGNGTFLSPVTVALSGNFSSSVRLNVGDFNGDGKLDVVVATDHLWVLLGNGAGGLGTPTSFGPVLNPSALLTGDFNGDGRLDLALVGADSFVVSIFAGDGAGGFAPPVSYATPDYPDGAASVDLDGDGRPDLVIGGGYPGQVTVLFNTNCVPSRLGETADPSCSPTGQVLTGQPVIEVLDDAGNAVGCDSGIVTASILPGTGAAGAVLGGTTSVGAVQGVATFSNLSINEPGAPYQLDFRHQGLSPVRSLPFSVGDPPPPPVSSSNSPVCEGQPLQLTASVVPGATYHWTGPNGFESGQRNPIIPSSSAAAAGDYSVALTLFRCSSQAATTNVTVLPAPSAAISAAASICPNGSGTASVPSAGLGATYNWTIVNGTIASGAGTPAVAFMAAPSGTVQLGVTVTGANGCAAAGSKSIAISSGPSCAGFFVVPPCRVADTRNPNGPWGGPALSANTVRTFQITGLCGIPFSARAVAINLAVVAPSDGGDLRVYPAGAATPLASAINFRSGVVRANNAIVPLGAGGQISVQCDMPSGSTDFFFDVYGYFQ